MMRYSSGGARVSSIPTPSFHIFFCQARASVRPWYLFFWWKAFCLVLHLVSNWTFSWQGVWGEGRKVWVPCNQWNARPATSAAQTSAADCITHTQHSRITSHPQFKSSQRWYEGFKLQQGLLAKVTVRCVCGRAQALCVERFCHLAMSYLIQPSHILPS